MRALAAALLILVAPAFVSLSGAADWRTVTEQIRGIRNLPDLPAALRALSDELERTAASTSPAEAAYLRVEIARTRALAQECSGLALYFRDDEQACGPSASDLALGQCRNTIAGNSQLLQNLEDEDAQSAYLAAAREFRARYRDLLLLRTQIRRRLLDPLQRSSGRLAAFTGRRRAAHAQNIAAATNQAPSMKRLRDAFPTTLDSGDESGPASSPPQDARFGTEPGKARRAVDLDSGSWEMTNARPDQTGATAHSFIMDARDPRSQQERLRREADVPAPGSWSTAQDSPTAAASTGWSRRGIDAAEGIWKGLHDLPQALSSARQALPASWGDLISKGSHASPSPALWKNVGSTCGASVAEDWRKERNNPAEYLCFPARDLTDIARGIEHEGIRFRSLDFVADLDAGKVDFENDLDGTYESWLTYFENQSNEERRPRRFVLHYNGEFRPMIWNGVFLAEE